MTDTINNKIPFVPENTIDPAAGLNISLNTIDALLQVIVQSVGANTPPTGVEGQRFIVGTAPTGAWAGQANKLARFLDSAWQFFDARYALNAADGNIWARSGSTWGALAGGGGGSGSGTVTSVSLTAPTGFDVSGSPITGAGTLGLSFSAGYSLPADTNQENWSTAFGWGDHALAGYEKQLTPGVNITIDRTDPDNPVISSTAAGGGGGDVVGPASATNNGVALFDGISGKLIKDGGVLGSAAFTDSTVYATSAQGALADTSLQPATIGTTVQEWSSNLDSWSGIEPSEKQDTLVSATNIRTINGASILGPGNLTVSGVAAWGSITGTLSDQVDLRSELDSKVDDSLVDFTIIYPNGGSEGSPANVVINTRYVETNPFPGHHVLCEAQILYSGVWVNPGWFTNNTTLAGVRASQGGSNIVVACAQTALLGQWNAGGGSSSYISTPIATPLPCRVKVWKVKGAVA